MSSGAVAMSFDPAFGMGPRSSFTWPHGPMEPSASPSSLLGSDISGLPPVSESSGTPESVPRSLTNSPPKGFTLDARGLERSRDQIRARRDSKLSQRMQRSDSNPYIGSPLLSDAGSMGMPVYTTTPPLSLLSEPSSSVPSQSFMHPYSPPMSEPVQGGSVFSTGYPHSMPSNYSMPLDYSTAYVPGEYGTRPLAPDNGIMYQIPAALGSGSATSQPDSGHVRVVQSRPKPRCWDHGCNGRQFSTFSNLLRHQREKSGQATKATCPNCGAEFTRTTARNGHLLHDKCKQRRNNSTSSISSGNASS